MSPAVGQRCQQRSCGDVAVTTSCCLKHVACPGLDKSGDAFLGAQSHVRAVLAAMAPKKRSAASGQATAKKQKSEAAAKAAASSNKEASLLQAQEALQDESASTRRTLKKRNTNDEVDRKIQSHFPGMSATQIESKRVDGLTLRERVERDTHEARGKKGSRLGASYWQDLQTTYAGQDSGPSALKVKDSNEPVSDALLQALSLALSQTLGG